MGEALAGRLGTATGRRSAPTPRVTDPAVVQAVFPVEGAFVVVTNGPPLGTATDSTWANPFTVTHRDARDVERFDPWAGAGG